jgi:hypothetical protein
MTPIPLGLPYIATSQLDIDPTMAANSDSKVPSQKAVKANLILTPTANATGFSLAGGTAPKTITVEDTTFVNQDLTTDASPTFAAVKTTTGAGLNKVWTSDAVGLGTWQNMAITDAASPPAIGETAPNTIRGKNVEIYKTASADSPLTAAQVGGTIVSNYGMTDADCVISLPTAALGYSFVLILPAVRARYFKLRADTNDKFYLSGVAGSDNGYVGVASGYVTGVACSFFTFKASDGGFDWFAIPIFGSWVAS